MRVRVNSSGPPSEEALRTVGAILIGAIERIEARKRATEESPESEGKGGRSLVA